LESQYIYNLIFQELSEYGNNLSRKIPDKATKSDADTQTVDLDLILVNDSIELKEEAEEEIDEKARLPKVSHCNNFALLFCPLTEHIYLT
jgi:hypothetical protein